MRSSQITTLSIAILSIIKFASAVKRKGRRRQLEPISTKLHASKETLRDRWVELLQSSYDPSNAIRLENRNEKDYYYSAEMLADQLLTGSAPDHILVVSRNDRLTNPLSKLWESIAMGSTAALAIFPMALLYLEVLPPSSLSSVAAYFTAKLCAFHTSLTPYLVPTIQTIQTSVKDQLIQAQSIIASLPYLLKHTGRIQLVPLAIKLIRKCIILEAWRHIWIRIYIISKKVWKGTRIGSAKAYTKFVPAWIRRGINSMFKSMVQAQVHGVVGSAMGGIYVSIMGDGLGSAVGEMSMDGSLDEVLETTIDASADTVGEQMASVVEFAVESAADNSVDAIGESLSSAVEGVSDAVADSLASAVEESVVGISEYLDSAVDSIIDGME